jgi:hypothetical protein
MIVRDTPAWLTAYQAACPVIAWDSVVDISNITATTSHADFPATNLANPATHLKWREAAFASPDTDEYITITVPETMASPPALGTIDYVAIAKHNFGSAGCVVSIESTTDTTSPFTGYVNIMSHTPSDDLPIIFHFAPTAASHVRIKITAGHMAREAAVVYAGQILVLERSVKIDVDHTPINLGRVNNIITGMSESGNFLGRLTKNHMRETKAEFSHFTPAWYRANFDPFLEVAHDIPFFWAWHPDVDTADVGYAWLTKDPTLGINPVTERFQVTLDMRGLA